MIFFFSLVVTSVQGNGSTSRAVSMEELQLKLQQSRKANEDLLNAISCLVKEKHDLSIEHGKENRANREEIVKLRKDLSQASAIINRVRNNLSSTFTSTQMEHILTGKPITRWREEDISRALTLRSLSYKSYKFIREVWQFPLPSRSTISRWVRGLDVEPGILMSIFNLMKHNAESMTERDRVCVLSFDECMVSKEWSYDKSTDVIYSPKKNVQFVMIRGLFQSWKQIIFYDFDCPMTKNLLFNLISATEAAGYPVVAIV